MSEVNTEKFMHDMRAVVIDAEELLKATAAQGGERVEKLRAHAEESLKAARARLLQAGESFGPLGVEAAREAVRQVDDQVRLHPWATAGIAAGVGVLLGVLIGRR